MIDRGFYIRLAVLDGGRLHGGDGVLAVLTVFNIPSRGRIIVCNAYLQLLLMKLIHHLGENLEFFVLVTNFDLGNALAHAGAQSGAPVAPW